MNTLVQYIVLRGDLYRQLRWSVGALIAQGCHACTAVATMFHDDPNMVQYVSNIDGMHKVVLEAENEESLQCLSQTLKENSIDFKLWIEQPENYSTCLVTKPYKKEDVQKFFKSFKLFK